MDQYYSSMHDTVASSTADDDDRHNNSSPGTDSQRSQDSEKLEVKESATSTTEVQVVDVHAPLGGAGLKPGTSSSERLSAEPGPSKNGEEEGELCLNSQSQSDRGAVGIVGDHLHLNNSLEERRASIGRGRQKRNRVIVVKNGMFTWLRKNGERLNSPSDGDSGGKKKKETTVEKNASSINAKGETTDSADASSPVEWVLADLNFTIYSVTSI